MSDYDSIKRKIIDQIPELEKLKGISQSSSTHYADAYTHTMDAIDFAINILREAENISPDVVRNDYIVAFREFSRDYISWLESITPNRIALAESDSKIAAFKDYSQPKFFTYIENVGYGPEDSKTGKGALLISIFAGHMRNLFEISNSREVKYSMNPYNVSCSHVLELPAAIDPILPDPTLTLVSTALHDIGKIIKNRGDGVSSCHDKAGFAYAGKLSKRFFSTSGRKDIEVMVLNHHIMPTSKSEEAFAKKYLEVIKYGHRFYILPSFYVMRTADILAHKDSFHSISDELFVDILNTIGAAQSEKMLGCPLHVFEKYLSIQIQPFIPVIREKILPKTFEYGIGNDFIFEYYYATKLVRNK